MTISLNPASCSGFPASRNVRQCKALARQRLVCGGHFSGFAAPCPRMRPRVARLLRVPCLGRFQPLPPPQPRSPRKRRYHPDHRAPRRSGHAQRDTRTRSTRQRPRARGLRRPHDRDRGVRIRLRAEVAADTKHNRHVMSQTASERRRFPPGSGRCRSRQCRWWTARFNPPTISITSAGICADDRSATMAAPFATFDQFASASDPRTLTQTSPPA